MSAITKYPVVKTSVVGPSLDVTAGVLPVAGDRQDTSEITDLKLFDFANGFDLGLFSDGDFETINGFDTALVMSVLCERRLTEDEEPISIKRGGWLGNQYSDIPESEIGSGVWQYYGRRLTSATLNGIKDKAVLSVQWLVDQGSAISVNATVVKKDRKTAILTLSIEKPDGTIDSTSLKLWNATPDAA